MNSLFIKVELHAVRQADFHFLLEPVSHSPAVEGADAIPLLDADLAGILLDVNPRGAETATANPLGLTVDAIPFFLFQRIGADDEIREGGGGGRRGCGSFFGSALASFA